jgi:glycosyltransferase involved in cell wall biosynthesis
VIKDQLASIIISSYNYARFLPEAIESALHQTHRDTEVIVVDDGSSDDSPSIIAGYGDRITPLLKENGGQASAWNEGFRASRGRVVCFLDSDDALLPTALEEAFRALRDPDVAKVHWRLWEVDQYGTKTGKLWPQSPLSEGRLAEELVKNGPYSDSYVWPPTAGNAWARWFLERVFPLPQDDYVTCADLYIAFLAPMFGRINKLLEPQGIYRVHDRNYSAKLPIAERIGKYDNACAAVQKYLRNAGLDLKEIPESWTNTPDYKWLRLLQAIADDLAPLIPPELHFILVDQDELREDFTQYLSKDLPAGLRAVPFLEHDGEYWGPPADDATAIQELERLRGLGASFIVFAWPAFWWFDYYAEFCHYLRSRFRRLLKNDRLVVFDLRN